MFCWIDQVRVAFAVAVLLPLAGYAQSNQITIDAREPQPTVQAVPAQLGTARNPAGETLAANSLYLTRNGKPWIPVMGEFHYSRYPEARWEQSILEMKAAGIQIVSSYVIWIHHEQKENVFDWSDNKNLRHFAELCAKHDMYFYPRIGPWAHAEVRNGGLPDWVVGHGSTRENNPTYLTEVQRFYHQIGLQLKGLYWKDGGPVIGIQLENEYRATGPGKGIDHIRMLKKMAVSEGMDVPFYTVIGWDGAAIPLEATLPVFGGYPDAPWGDSPNPMPPAEIYTFRFDNRAAGSMGAIGGSGQSPSSVYRKTPFLTAEVGAGIQDTYFRRPVVSTDDIAAIAPIMLGSGANLLGYYMFHGGRNPEGGAITLQESQLTGYPTDVPEKSYDFQAPISNNGEERESMRRLKLVHYFLNDFSDRLAPMSPRRPAQMPTAPTDLNLPRVSARSAGDSAFLFVSNYTRGAEMPARRNFSVELKLPNRTITVPTQPIVLPSGAYGIWPVHQSFGGVNIEYSTAQLFKYIAHDQDQYYLFFAIPGIRAEFLFPANGAQPHASRFIQRKTSAGLLLQAENESGELIMPGDSGRTHFLLLSRTEAEQIWKLDDPHALLSTSSQFSLQTG